MNEDTVKVVIKPVSQWTTVAVQHKHAGCPNVTTFIMTMMLSCIRVPPTEIVKIRKAWKDDEN